MIIPARSRLEPVASGIARCPQCGRLMDVHVRRCPHCRAEAQLRRRALGASLTSGGRPFFLAAGLISLLLITFLLLA